GVKCLHAHLADGLAGGDNPIFDRIQGHVLPAECDAPCVIASAEGCAVDPTWKEPAPKV
ncbi:MAG: DUF501 domain-containing protein, partial [Deltaproteobacteria bacterium]|nr:DUF501 domain-containing protein [Deltaproteobacteria bacterium]